MLNTKSEKLFVFNFAILTGIIFSIYFLSPLRMAIEKPFYAIKSYLASYAGDPTHVVIVGIDEEDIRRSDEGAKEFSYGALNALIQRILRDNPKTVSVLLHSQVYKYDNPEREVLYSAYASYSNVFFGVFDQSKDQLQNLTSDRIHKTILPSGISRRYREEMVRTLPVRSVSDVDQQPYLIAQVAKVAAPEEFREFDLYLNQVPEKEGLKSVVLKYYRPEKLIKVSVRDVLSGRVNHQLKNANVVVGYSAFRNFGFRVSETTFVNTPFQFQEADLKDGSPLVEVIATAMENLISGQYVRESPVFLNILQVLPVAIFCWFIWTLPVQVVFLILFLSLLGLIFIQSLVLAYFRFDLPTADAVMVGFFVTFAASILRAKQEITSRLRDQESMEAQARLLSLQKSFLGNMSVTLIQTSKDICSRLVKHRDYFSKSADTQEAYANACNSALEFEDYLGGIQQFMSAQLDSVHVKVDSVQLDKIIETIIKRFSSRIDAKKQTIEIDLAVKEIQSDATVIDQVLHNLISNSVKYSPDGTSIRIGSVLRGDFVLLSVYDQGPGIAADEHEKIFEKFYRVKDDNVYRIKGTGLGLYLSRYFARHLGGDVTVVSEKNQGATFTLKLRLR